ncbi:MAG TPA: polysaccharide biosynthesis/export family protein [Vicinamibacterales bacterium]
MTETMRNLRFVEHHLILTGIAVGLIVATARPSLAGAQEAPDQRREVADYVIGPEDVLDVSVWENTQISRTVPVRPDGKISLPLVNDVQAAGLTPMQLREALTALLVPYVSIPAVSVIVREVHSFKVTVLGEVRTPGRYHLKSRSTVLDLLAMAGGLTEYAARGRIVVLRRDGAGRRHIPFAFDKLTAKQGASGPGPRADAPDAAQANFDVEPDDIILVP